MNIRKYSFIFLLCISIFSCTKDQLCNTLAKADMVFDLMSMVNPQVTVGIAFVINSVVQNTAAGDICGTASSGEHITSYISQFRDNPNDAWALIDFIDGNGNISKSYNVKTPDISEDSIQPINLELEMSVPGKYMIIGSSDSFNDVNERNENNNGAETDEGSLGGLWENDTKTGAKALRTNILDGLIEGKDYIIIEVKENPNNDPMLSGEKEPRITVHNITFSN
jgi:hypothetical protein